MDAKKTFGELGSLNSAGGTGFGTTNAAAKLAGKQIAPKDISTILGQIAGRPLETVHLLQSVGAAAMAQKAVGGNVDAIA